MFALLGVKPVIGRGLTADDDRLGVPLTTVLSHELWETQFGKDPGVIGTDVKLSDSHYTVVGVMPPGFRFEIASQFWLPAVPTLDPSTRPSIRTVSVFARLAPGRTIADLRAELATVEPAVVGGAGAGAEDEARRRPAARALRGVHEVARSHLRRDRRVPVGASRARTSRTSFSPARSTASVSSPSDRR